MQKLIDAVNRNFAKIEKAYTYIWEHPETGFKEWKTHAYLAEEFRALGYELVEAGNTVLVIEHNLDVIKTADYIIDIGPEGGDKGGTVVATGTPEEIVKNKKSYTGKYVKKYLEKE